ncbi:MAG: UDP-glucose 4-epimerase GalE [Porticoccus sp.]|nr:UDP-glucose 4-epimerase GalE [Porticoccus sp.]
MTVLVTGGAGYIGSHTCVALLENNYDIVVLDNLSNSCMESLTRVSEITGKKFPIVIDDVNNAEALDRVFKDYQIDAVMHLAGKKAVGESCELPLDYYRNNVAGTLTLCEAMKAHRVRTLIFSSSATVYGDPQTSPITEDFPLSATNPYGQSKLMVEEILRDLVRADELVGEPLWSVALLRYFNPVGAHSSGRIGEDPGGIPNNLLPYISQVAVGKLKQLSVFGDDYPTRDGTGVRDYIHVMDLAEGHVKALDKLIAVPSSTGCYTWNLGTGNGYSVLEMVKAFEEASGRAVPYQVIASRPGDVAECWADSSKAEDELGWKASRGLSDMMEDTWRWQYQNPDGFGQ